MADEDRTKKNRTKKKVPPELWRALHACLDQALTFEARRDKRQPGEDESEIEANSRSDYLGTELNRLARRGVNLPRVLRVIEKAWEDKRHERERREVAEKYEIQLQGQGLLGVPVDMLMKSLPRTDINRPLLEQVFNSTMTDNNPAVSPPPQPIEPPRIGNPPMPWIDTAREGLRQAGISDEETREVLLSIFGLKRKQRKRKERK